MSDIWDDDNEVAVKSNWMKWGKVGDNLVGTLTGKRASKSNLPDTIGQPQTIYEFKIQKGVSHDTKSGEEIVLEKDETYMFSGKAHGKSSYDSQLKTVEVGTIVGIKFVEERPNKNKALHAQKIIKVYVKKDDKGNPAMDEEWLESSEADPFNN